MQPELAEFALRRAQGPAAFNPRRTRTGRSQTRGRACPRSCGRPSMPCSTCRYPIRIGTRWSRSLRGRAISDASCAVVENVARGRPTVLLMEDLHWVDRASDAVMAALASLKTPHLLIVVTSRPTGIPKWIDQCDAEIVALRPLDESSGRAMLDAILGVSSTTFDLKGRIIRHTASVPLFVEEVCRRPQGNRRAQGRMGQSDPRPAGRRSRHSQQRSRGDRGASGPPAEGRAHT